MLGFYDVVLGFDDVVLGIYDVVLCFDDVVLCFDDVMRSRHDVMFRFADVVLCFDVVRPEMDVTQETQRGIFRGASRRCCSFACLLPSLSSPAKANQQGHKAKEVTSNEEAAAPPCIWPSNGCCSPEIGAGKPSNSILSGASRRILLPAL